MLHSFRSQKGMLKMKKCKLCQTDREESKFCRGSLVCTPCYSEKRRERKRKNPEKYYGISYVKEKTCVFCGKLHKRKNYESCSMKCLLQSRIKKVGNCWEWQGSMNENGYGFISMNRKHFFAHRISFEEYKGKIPDGMCLLHSCDNRKCINPDCLIIGTRRDNALDMYKKNRNRCEKGSERFCAKLKEEDVIRIKKMISEGMMQKTICEMYGVNDSTISNIKKNKTWKHVKD